MDTIGRRRFLTQATTSAGAFAAGLAAGCGREPPNWTPPAVKPFAGRPEEPPSAYPPNRPNVILVRFGGGVRRRETVAFPEKTFCPFILHELAGKHGVLFENVEIANAPGVLTSHGQGTLYLLTGEYRAYENVSLKPFAEHFEPPLPTIPEYLRKRYGDVGEHEALIVNGEDRIFEEFYTFSNHHRFGIGYRSTVLSLYGFKTYLLRKQLEAGGLPDAERRAKEERLEAMLSRDYRAKDQRHRRNPQVEEFWAGWRGHYGDSGLVNPRGDRLLTALALRALKMLRPRFLMINYQDTDYVHWGPANFYTRGISVIDDGVREIFHAVQADEHYRDNTVFVVVPDCGRDNSRGAAVPFQHHFNSKSAHEVFAVVAGPKRFVPHASRRVDRLQQQISVAATVGELMGFHPTEADAGSLFEVV